MTDNIINIPIFGEEEERRNYNNNNGPTHHHPLDGPPLYHDSSSSSTSGFVPVRPPSFILPPPINQNQNYNIHPNNAQNFPKNGNTSASSGGGNGGGGGGGWGGAFFAPPPTTYGPPPGPAFNVPGYEQTPQSGYGSRPSPYNSNNGGGGGGGLPGNWNMGNNFSIPLGIGLDTAQKLTTGVQSQGQRYFDSLRPYFNVKKRYVQQKLGILLIPYLHKSWFRAQDTIIDINSPDLYIPLMSLITYILLVGFFKGTLDKFSPDVLGTTLTTVLIILVFEVLAIKGSAVLWPHQTPILDILSYSGYKFVGIIINVIIGLAFGNYGFYVAFLLTSLSTCFFQFKTYQSIMTNNGTSPKSFLLLIIIIQILTGLFFM